MAKLTVRDFQDLIERTYGEKDSARGTAGTFMWFAEEVGELSRALRRGQRGQLEAEFADVFAWLATLASIHGVDLGAAAQAKYGQGCPRCGGVPCRCDDPHAGHGEPAAKGGAAGKPAKAPAGTAAAPPAPAAGGATRKSGRTPPR